MQKLFKSGTLHLATNMTRCGALIPLGPALCDWNKRPYFACRHKMLTHVQMLVRYCESTWITHSHACAMVHRLCAYCTCKSDKKIAEARLWRALTGTLNIGLMLSKAQQLIAIGGFIGTFAKGFFTVMGNGRVPTAAPYTVTRL